MDEFKYKDFSLDQFTNPPLGNWEIGYVLYEMKEEIKRLHKCIVGLEKKAESYEPQKSYNF